MMCDEDKKWACTCTYLNYANAMKCTMCLTPKPSNLIVDTNSDIYKIGSDITFGPSPEKWTCHICTYLNFPKAIRCTQCRSQKLMLSEKFSTLSISKVSSPSPPCEFIDTAPIGETGDTCQKLVKTSSSKYEKMPCYVPCADIGQSCNLSGRQPGKTASHSSIEPIIASYKWSCKACTYENWPRAKKCVMCNTPKGCIPSPVLTQCRNSVTPPGLSSKSLELTTADEQNVLQIVQSSSPEKCNKTDGCEAINEFNKSLSESKESKQKLVCSGAAEVAVVPVSNSSSPIQSQRPAEGAMALNNYETEQLLKCLRRRLRETDFSWLNACNGVIEGNYEPVEAFFASGGDPMRHLTAKDIVLLGRSSILDEGHTLVHLAIRFGREDLLATILSHIDGGGAGMKRVPPFVAPDLANDIGRFISTSLRQRKGPLPCCFLTEMATFSLPAEIDDLPPNVQEQLFEEILDREAQKQLEEDTAIINWSLEITDRLGSRLYALWNRTAGDCLLDSVLQATWGVFDRDNILRRALADSLSEAAHFFFPCWKEYEQWQACLLDYYIPEGQILEEWRELVCLASQPGSALEQLHIFVVAHILRRPIIVYGVKNVKSFRGEDLGFARFEGVYLPLMWESSFCWKSPIALGYTRGHFSALVPIEPDTSEVMEAGAILSNEESQIVFLPLMSHNGKLLPVHFLSHPEIGQDERLLRQWMEVCVSESGILVAQQQFIKKPLAMAQMIEEWLNHYRRLAQMECVPLQRSAASQCYSSDGDSDEE